VGSPAVAAWIAQALFWTLIVVGGRELGRTRVVTFLVLWIGAFVSRSYVPYGAALFSSYVALLDIILVFLILKGDIRIT
jgi:hypothetical protein